MFKGSIGHRAWSIGKDSPSARPVDELKSSRSGQAGSRQKKDETEMGGDGETGKDDRRQRTEDRS